MLAPLRFYEMYVAFQTHIKSDSYNYFSYGGKTNVSQASFTGRNDKYFFEKWAGKLAGESGALEFLTANFINGKTYIRNFDMKDYQGHIGYRDAVYYRFENDLKTLYTLKEDRSLLDTLIEETFRKVFPLEFIILLDLVTDGKMVEKLNQKNNIIWDDELCKKVLTFRPFMKYNWGINDQKIEELQKIYKKVQEEKVINAS